MARLRHQRAMVPESKETEMPHFQDVIAVSTAAEIGRLANHLRRAAEAHHQHERNLVSHWFWQQVGAGKLEALHPYTHEEMVEALQTLGLPTSDPLWADWYAQWMVDHACMSDEEVEAFARHLHAA